MFRPVSTLEGPRNRIASRRADLNLQEHVRPYPFLTMDCGILELPTQEFPYRCRRIIESTAVQAGHGRGLSDLQSCMRCDRATLPGRAAQRDCVQKMCERPMYGAAARGIRRPSRLHVTSSFDVGGPSKEHRSTLVRRKPARACEAMPVREGKISLPTRRSQNPGHTRGNVEPVILGICKHNTLKVEMTP